MQRLSLADGPFAFTAARSFLVAAAAAAASNNPKYSLPVGGPGKGIENSVLLKVGLELCLARNESPGLQTVCVCVCMCALTRERACTCVRACGSSSEFEALLVS